MGLYKRPLRFVTTEDNCYMCVSHKVNIDGYLRFNFDGTLIMFHRLIWQHHYGEVPSGYGIHHRCNSRNCCNIEHLQLINISEHKTMTNANRYKDRIEAIRKLKGSDKLDVASKFKVSPATVSKIWKKTSESFVQHIGINPKNGGIYPRITDNYYTEHGVLDEF